MMQAVAAKVEQLELFGQQELFGPEMFDDVTGQIHLHYVRRQVRRDVIQICRSRKTHKHKTRRKETHCTYEHKNIMVHSCIDVDRFTGLRQMCTDAESAGELVT